MHVALRFLNLVGGTSQRLLFHGLGLECCFLELLPQDADRGVKLDRFVVSGGAEALDLLPVLLAQVLDRVPERRCGLA